MRIFWVFLSDVLLVHNGFHLFRERRSLYHCSFHRNLLILLETPLFRLYFNPNIYKNIKKAIFLSPSVKTEKQLKSDYFISTKLDQNNKNALYRDTSKGSCSLLRKCCSFSVFERSLNLNIAKYRWRSHWGLFCQISFELL